MARSIKKDEADRLAREIARIQERLRRLQLLDPRPAEEILGYDGSGLPT